MVVLWLFLCDDENCGDVVGQHADADGCGDDAPGTAVLWGIRITSLRFTVSKRPCLSGVEDL